MRPLRKIIEDLHTQLARPVNFPQLPQLILEFDEKCCDKATINKLKTNKKKLEQVRVINAKIIEIYANTVSSVTSKLFSQLNLEEIKTWPKAPTFTQLIDLWNCYSDFIINDILAIKNLEQRNLLIERWIAVAKKLHQEQDFFNAQALFTSITKTEVERLYKDATHGLSVDALRRLSELNAIYGLLKNSELCDKFIFPAVGPKLANVYSAIQASKANLEGQSTIKGREERQADTSVSDAFCLKTVKMMYNNYEEKIVEHKILAALSQSILIYMPQARTRRVLGDLTSKCTNLETTRALLKTENLRNNTPENTTKLANLDKEIASLRKSIAELNEENAKTDHETQQKTISIKPRNSVLSPSILTAKVGSLLPSTPTLPAPKTNTPAPATPVLPTVSPPRIATPMIRDRSQSTSMLNSDVIPFDLHGSTVITQTETFSRERSLTVSSSDLGFFQASHSKETFSKTTSTSSFTSRSVSKGTADNFFQFSQSKASFSRTTSTSSLSIQSVSKGTSSVRLKRA